MAIVSVPGVELFGIMRRLPMRIELVAGNLDIYKLLSSVNDETIIETFKLQNKALEITVEQFFYGFNRIHAIGFVRSDELRICENLARCLRHAPDGRQVYRMRDAGTLILAPASVQEPSWMKTMIHF